MFKVAVALVLGGALLFAGAPDVVASDHNWGSGRTYRECTNQGLTDYGPKTGQRWIGDFYANLYHCEAPTTTTTRAPDWGSGRTYRECTDQGLTEYGSRTGRRWIGNFYANLYQCEAPFTATPDPEEALRPDNYSSPGIRVTELSLESRPTSPFIFQPRPGIPAWDSSLPIDWAADPFADRNWQFQLHAWVNMNYWLDAYQEGDMGALEQAVAIALDWYRFHIEENRRSAFEWYDMAAGIRASRLAFLLDSILLGNLEVEEEEWVALVRLADLHVVRLRQPSFLSDGNHGLYQLAGLNALCAVIGWRSVCAGASSYVDQALSRLLDRWFTAESVHRENSPNYHGIVVDALQRLRVAERFRISGVRGLIEEAERVTPWLTYPDGRWVPVGDSAGVGPRLDGPVEATCLERGGGCWAVRDLTESGYAIIRSAPGTEDPSLLFVNAMFIDVKGGVIRHKHADDLGFVLIEGGREIFVDSGKYGYQKDRMRSYVLSARAHNIPSLIGRPIDPRRLGPAETRLQPIEKSRSGFVVRGFVDRPGLLRHQRTFTYLPGSSLTITDRLHNRTRHRWQSNLHLAPDLRPTITESGFVVAAGDLRVEAEFKGTGCAIDMARGETEPYQGWVSTGYLQMTPATVVRASCPAEVVETSWHITIRR